MKISYSNKTLNAKPSGLELAKYFGKKGTSNRIQFNTLKSAVYSLAQFKIKTGTNVFHFYMHLCNVFWGGREKS